MKIDDSTQAWYLYVVHCYDNTLYTGITTNLKRRTNEHNTSLRGSKYTRTRRPVRLVYWKVFENRSRAQKAEYKFKKLTRQQKNEVISKKDICDKENV